MRWISHYVMQKEIHYSEWEIIKEKFFRSAMKPLQAIALIELLNETNKQDSITAAEIALICASHNGEEFQKRQLNHF